MALSKERIRECSLTGDQDCEAGIPIVFYGQTFRGKPLENTTEHVLDAITNQQKPLVLRAWAVQPADHGRRNWYEKKPECNVPAKRRYVEAAKK